jgi:hypothetical protein
MELEISIAAHRHPDSAYPGDIRLGTGRRLCQENAFLLRGKAKATSQQTTLARNKKKLPAALAHGPSFLGVV